jgi:hypothetical protein
VQHVRAPALDEGRTLRNAEPVLLVDDSDGEVPKVDPLLDERVRPDHHLRVSRGDQLPRESVLARTQRAGEQHDPNTKWGAELLDREEVLLRERLGRRHERPLTSRLDRAQKGVQRHDRLARPDVALEEALHRHRAGEVSVDLVDGPLLIGGEREWQRLAVADDELSRRADGLRRGALTRDGSAQQRETENEQLVEGEAHPPHLGLGQRPWSVYGPKRIGARWEPLRGE